MESLVRVMKAVTASLDHVVDNGQGCFHSRESRFTSKHHNSSTA